MNLTNTRSEKRKTLIFITLITVCLFLIVQDITPAFAGDVEKETISDVKEGSGDIIAEVDGKSISTGELLKEYNLYFLISRFSRTYQKGLTINSYLDLYISDILLLREADKMGINVTGDEVENQKKRYLKLFRFNDEKTLSKWLELKTLTLKDANLYFENDLKLKRLYIKKFGVKEIPDEEVREYYKANNEYFNRPAKILASHILICHNQSKGCMSNLSKSEAKDLAESVRKSATPENFATLAQRYSYDSTGKSGGSLGTVTQGTAVPAFEKAAFSLEKGEISDPVETDYGYHIIYVTDKAEELSISFEEAREAINYTLEEEQITSELLKYAEQLKKDAKIRKYTEADRKGPADLKDQAYNKKSDQPAKQYSTFKATGKGMHKNSKGQPIIILFTRVGCHFCEWVQDTFEEVVKEYVDKGLIEAHHYDYTSKDDLLTPEIENEIPPEFEKIFEYDNPNSATPYFDFGGMYYRRGTGYFDQDDLYAEELEMKQIIDDLLR